ncbi:MAG: peptide chain release factor N(5)-glutamine methyltransferase [Simkaniaceae bacterium]
MRTLGHLLHFSKRILEKNEVRRSRQTAEEILSGVFHLPRVELYLYFDRPVLSAEWQLCQKLLDRKISGEPLEHLLKVIHFFHCKIEVDSQALIPRQETEIMLQKVCSLISKLKSLEIKAWDLCTGTGCLGLALKCRFPSIDVTLSDLSPHCTALARRNAERNSLTVSILEGDLLEPFEGQKADIILCNPPYISDADYQKLDRSVFDFEPKMALVGGVTGLEFYEKLASDLPSFLNEGAFIFLEIGYDQGEALLELFSAACWSEKDLSKDWSGHDRFLFMRFTKDLPCSV